jgi:hypothetical protein
MWSDLTNIVFEILVGLTFASVFGLGIFSECSLVASVNLSTCTCMASYAEAATGAAATVG